MASARELFLHDETWPEARAILTEFYNEVVRKGYTGPVDVIHGWGSTGVGGVKRHALRTFLTRHGIAFVTGEQKDGNPGHTILTPGPLLPTAENELQSDILEFCAAPKTRSKIDGRFRKHGIPAITSALKSLQRSGLISLRTVGAVKTYTAEE